MTQLAIELRSYWKWTCGDEDLIYVGKSGPWNQFALVESPNQVWCEVLDSDMHMLEGIRMPLAAALQLEIDRATKEEIHEALNVVAEYLKIKGSVINDEICVHPDDKAIGYRYFALAMAFLDAPSAVKNVKLTFLFKSDEG